MTTKDFLVMSPEDMLKAYDAAGYNARKASSNDDPNLHAVMLDVMKIRGALLAKLMGCTPPFEAGDMVVATENLLPVVLVVSHNGEATRMARGAPVKVKDCIWVEHHGWMLQIRGEYAFHHYPATSFSKAPAFRPEISVG